MHLWRSLIKHVPRMKITYPGSGKAWALQWTRRMCFGNHTEQGTCLPLCVHGCFGSSFCGCQRSMERAWLSESIGMVSGMVRYNACILMCVCRCSHKRTLKPSAWLYTYRLFPCLFSCFICLFCCSPHDPWNHQPVN